MTLPFEIEEEQEPNFPYVLNRRWEVVDRLGQGGMGTVYMARDLNLQTLGQQKKACVVKELRDDFFRQEDREKAQEFFLREVRVLAALDHPNIVRVLDQFTQNGKYYLVMEYVQGQNLHEMMLKRQQPFDEEQVIEWAIQICDVLHYLHTHDPPVIYRDLKPSNVMISSKDQVKLVDFGIARPYEESEDNTHVVSQGYSPPEQYWGAADTRSDIYALGATMHFLLTGRDPLALTTASPQASNPDVSDRVDEIVQRATQQDVWSRYQSALEFREELAYKPLDDRPVRPKIGYVVAIGFLSVGLFLGALVFISRLHEQSEMAAKQVDEYKSLKERTEAEKLKLKEDQEKFAQFRNMYITKELGGPFTTPQVGPDATGDLPMSVEPPKESIPYVSPSGIPVFEETNEAALTDPEGLQ